MRTKPVAILLAVTLAGIGGYYVFTKRASQAPVESEAWRSTLQIATTTERKDPNSPYIDLDPKLHVDKSITLDPEVVTINYELKDVMLCGETYKAKQVMIDGVDVVQRVAELLASAPSASSTDICEIVLNREVEKFGGWIGSGAELHIVITKDLNDPDYIFGIAVSKFLSNELGSWTRGVSVRASEIRNYIVFGREFGLPQIRSTLH
jgi:hypothetical protein